MTHVRTTDTRVVADDESSSHTDAFSTLSKVTLGDFELFCALIDCGGFRDTAKHLGMSQAAVSRRIGGLEQQLGITLLERTTRTMRLTASGKRFLSEARQFSAFSQYLTRRLETSEACRALVVESVEAHARLMGLRFRSDSLASIAKWWMRKDHRWLSITGAGGVGKSLMMRVLHAELKSQSPALTTWCDFSTCVDLTQALMLLSAKMGVPCPNHELALEHLTAYLRLRPHTLFLDNVDNIADARTLVNGLIEYCDYVRIIVTSRSALESRYETEHRLQSLPIPPHHVNRLKRAREYPGYKLFEEALARRANLVVPERLNQRAGAHYIAACQRTGGLPLAIELLAAHCARTGVEHAFDMFTTSEGSHVTSRATAEPPIVTDLGRHRSLYDCFRSSWLSLDTSLQDFAIILSFVDSTASREELVELAPVIEKYSPNLALLLLARASFLEGAPATYRMLSPIRELIHDFATKARILDLQRRLLEWLIDLSKSLEPRIIESVDDSDMTRVTRLRHWFWYCAENISHVRLYTSDDGMRLLALSNLGFTLGGDPPHDFTDQQLRLLDVFASECHDLALLERRLWSIASTSATQHNDERAHAMIERAERVNGLTRHERLARRLDVHRELAVANGDMSGAIEISRRHLILCVRAFPSKAAYYAGTYLVHLAVEQRWEDILRFCARSYVYRRMPSTSQSYRFAEALRLFAHVGVHADSHSAKAIESLFASSPEDTNITDDALLVAIWIAAIHAVPNCRSEFLTILRFR
ncbi:MAG: LysR family transcriptional regulator, partial [Casimicrobium sp.]